jgi:6-phosphogluconolactonase
MTNERRVLIHPDKASLSGSVAARFITKTIDLLEDRDADGAAREDDIDGVAVLAAINASPARDSVDWSRVSFWWGDERFVAKNDPERNELQARQALLDHIAVPEEQIHAFPSSDEMADIDEAAASYALELLEAGDGKDYPKFDITFLGVGSDGHIASLFPGQEAVRATDVTVVAVRESPKPPPLRLSLTLPVLRSSDRIWLVLAGSDKASALGLALAGASTDEVPVAGAEGRRRTVFFVDKEAAAEVPEYLITPTYY